MSHRFVVLASFLLVMLPFEIRYRGRDTAPEASPDVGVAEQTHENAPGGTAARAESGFDQEPIRVTDVSSGEL